MSYTSKRTPEQDEFCRLFHAAWGQAAGSPTYNKEVWRQLSRFVDGLVKPSEASTREPIEDPDEQWKGFPIGHWLALLCAANNGQPVPRDSADAIDRWRDSKLAASRAARATKEQP